jgi:hypothetical protein
MLSEVLYELSVPHTRLLNEVFSNLEVLYTFEPRSCGMSWYTRRYDRWK